MSQISRGEQGQPYQGYPNVTPVVREVASPNEESMHTRSDRDDILPYINKMSQEANPGLGVTECSTIPISKPGLDLDRTPVVYIDIPQGSSGVTDRRPDHERSFRGIQADGPSGSKGDEDRPVVYIDIPECNCGSEVSQTNEGLQPDYVQETIFYDPFKDMRIEMPRHPDSEGSRTPESSRRMHRRPEPSRNLNIVSPGSSGFGSGSSSSSYTLNPYLNRDTPVYGHTPNFNDEFSLSPLSVNNTPFPPPYAVVDQRYAVGDNASPQTSITEQPRTQLVTSPIAAESTRDSRRLVETCQYCHNTVTTLVVKQNGLLTHVLAVFLFWLLPLILLYYMLGCCRYRNHYCPSCNRKIGYQYPEYCCNDTFHYAI